MSARYMHYLTDKNLPAVSFCSHSTDTYGCFLVEEAQEVDKWSTERNFKSRLSENFELPPMWARWSGFESQDPLADVPETERKSANFKTGSFHLPGVEEPYIWAGLDPDLCCCCGCRMPHNSYTCDACGGC